MYDRTNQMPTYALVSLFSGLIIHLGDLSPSETRISTYIEKTKGCKLDWFWFLVLLIPKTIIFAIISGWVTLKIPFVQGLGIRVSTE